MLSRLQGRVRLKDRLPEAQILKCRVYATSAHIIGTYSATNRTPHTVGNHLDGQIDTPRPRGGRENWHGSSTSDSELHCLWLQMVWQPHPLGMGMVAPLLELCHPQAALEAATRN